MCKGIQFNVYGGDRGISYFLPRYCGNISWSIIIEDVYIKIYKNIHFYIGIRKFKSFCFKYITIYMYMYNAIIHIDRYILPI